VTAFLAATATKVSIYVLIRFYYSVFGESLVFRELPLPQILLVLSLAAMFGASAMAIFQHDLKRLFAYSSVAQIGYITLGLSFDSASGLTASIVHLFNHAITKGGLFLMIGAAVAVAGGSSLARLAGMGRSMPLTSFGIVLGGLSLIGVPGSAGFISKWYLILAALEQGDWWLAVAIVASSLLAVAYVWRFVEVVYFRAPRDDLARQGEAPPALLLPAWVLIAATVYFGLETSISVDSAAAAASLLLGSAK
jgi:multicomponent Na+:H+ antiporter subunit D